MKSGVSVSNGWVASVVTNQALIWGEGLFYRARLGAQRQTFISLFDRINKQGKWAKIILQQNISTLPFGLEIQCLLFDSSREVVVDRSPPSFFPNLMIVNRQRDTLRPIGMPAAALAENRRGTYRVRLTNDESTSISIK